MDGSGSRARGAVTRSGPTTRRQIHVLTLGVFVLYLLFALGLFWHGEPLASKIFGDGTDPIAFVWYVKWWPYAIAHGLNPFQTTKIWHGVGYNLAWTTSLMVPALLLTPLTLLAGPLVSYNLLCLLMPAAAAQAAFLLLRATVGRPLPCFLGGLLYGFSSYESSQLLSHINLAITFLPPLALLLCLRRTQDRIGRAGFIVLLAGLALAQLGCSEEILLTSSLFGALFWALRMIFASPDLRARLWRLAAEIAASGLLTMIAAAPFLYYFVIGFSEVPAQLNDPGVFSLDPLSLVIPSVVDAAGGSMLLPLSNLFSGGQGEQGGYLGVLLLLIAGAVILSEAGWTRRLAPISIMTILVLVASFGPYPHLLNHRSHIQLPWSVLARRPVFNAIMPARLSLYLALCVAFLLAEWTSMRGPRFAAVGVLAVLLLLPNPLAFRWYPWPADPFFTPASIARTLGPDKTVLVLPFGATGPGMAWQLDAGLTFDQSGGYAGYTPRVEDGFDLLRAFREGAPERNFPDDMRAYTEIHHLDAILVGPGTPEPLRKAISALGWQTQHVGDVEVVRPPPLDTLRYTTILGDYWPSGAPFDWIGARLRVLTRGERVSLTFSAAARPPGLPPAAVTVDWPSGPQHIALSRTTPATVSVPPSADFTITAGPVFVPARVEGNADWRALSVTMSVARQP